MRLQCKFLFFVGVSWAGRGRPVISVSPTQAVSTASVISRGSVFVEAAGAARTVI